LSVTSGNKRIEYFPEENIIISVNIAEDDINFYSDDESPKEKKIACKIVDYTLSNRWKIESKEINKYLT
jgi:hypothetical protein